MSRSLLLAPIASSLVFAAPPFRGPLHLSPALAAHCPLVRPWLHEDGSPATMLPSHAIAQRKGLVEVTRFMGKPSVDASPRVRRATADAGRRRATPRLLRFADLSAALAWACMHNHLLVCELRVWIYDVATGTRYQVPAGFDFTTVARGAAPKSNALALQRRAASGRAGRPGEPCAPGAR